MAWNVQDLAQVTHLLISQLNAAIKASPRYVQNHFPFEVSGLMPAVSRTDGTNVLSLYLLHVGRDPYWRNTPVQGQRGQLNTSQPLSLNLSYLLTSYSEKNWHMEQYLMSVALAYFHANPIYKSATAEFSVTVEADSIEEMSRLWQAITVPIRLSAMFRVAIVFLAPELPPVDDMRTPVEVSLSVSPDLNFVAPTPEPPPHLFEVAPQVAYRVDPNPIDPAPPFALIGQPGAAAGESVRLLGSGLDQANAGSVYLSPAGGGAEWPLPASWRAFGTAASGTAGNADEVLVRLPVTYGVLPASGTTLTDTPPPGAYQIAVGHAGVGFRSNVLALSIAPQVSGIGPGLTELQPDPSHVYSFSASGLVAGQTSVLIDQTALTIAGAVAPGVATVDAGYGSNRIRVTGGRIDIGNLCAGARDCEQRRSSAGLVGEGAVTTA